MADLTTDQLVANIAQLQRSVDKLADNIFGGAATRKRREREKPNTEKLATQGRDPVKEAAQALRTEKALKDLKKSLDDSFKDTRQYGNDMRVAGAAFDNAVKKITLKQFDELPKKISALTASVGLEFKSMGDVQKALIKYSEENIDAAKHYQQELFRLTAGTKEYEKTLDEINKLGYENIAELNKSKEELMGFGTAVGKAVNQQTKEIEKNTTSTSRWTKAIAYAEGATLLLANKFIETLTAADKYNTTVKSTGIGMTELGMSADAFGRLQNENLPTLNASGTSLDQFNDYLTKTSWSLLTYTGSLEDGAKLAAQANKQSIQLTSVGDKQNQYIQQNAEQFRKMHNVLGTTTEQYLELNSSLMNSQSVQTNLYRLNEQQRAQAVVSLKQATYYLQTQGLELEQAKGVVEMFQELNAQSPKNRRKQAAEIAAIGGAIGLGPEARELAQLIQRGARTPEEKQRQVELEAQLQKGTQAKYAATAPGGPEETVLNELINRPGVAKIFGDTGAQALIGQRQGAVISPEKQLELQNKAIHETEKSNRWLELINKTIIGLNGVLTGFLGTGLVGTVTAVIGIIAGKNLLQTLLGGKAAGGLIGRAAGALAGIEGGAGAAAGGTGAAVTAGGIGAAATMIAGGALAGAAAYGLTTLITDTIPKALGAKQGLGEFFGSKLADWTESTPTSPSVYKNYNKDAQVQGLMDQYNADVAKGDQVDADDLLKKMDELVTSLAEKDKRDPAMAVERLHKTIKDQHQENKALTQEQTDALKGQTSVKAVKTSNRISAVS